MPFRPYSPEPPDPDDIYFGGEQTYLQKCTYMLGFIAEQHWFIDGMVAYYRAENAKLPVIER
jgi:hypothetical protein